MSESDRQKQRPKPVQGDDVQGARAKDGAGVDSTIQAHIGRHLRALYDDIVEQPVPERFRKLLEELEQKKAGQG
jgi:hypothetical protein